MNKRSTESPDGEFSNKSQKLKSDADEDEDTDEDEDEEDECPICREGFTELNPPYPIGDKCEVQQPNSKHKYHSHCLSATYHSIPANFIASRKACPLCGTDRSAPNDNYGITQELIDDVDARTAQELLAAQAAQAAAPPPPYVEWPYATSRAAYIAAQPEHPARYGREAQYPGFDAYAAAHIAAHPAYAGYHSFYDGNGQRRIDEVYSDIIYRDYQIAHQSARAADQAADQAAACPNGNCNIMGGKFRKSRRKSNRKSKRKTNKKSNRKSNRKKFRKRKTKRN